jgi:uncharacterized delta-60 repeat protein
MHTRSRTPSRPVLLGMLFLAQIAVRSASAAPGDPDPTFGSGGEVSTDITTGEDTAFALVQQPDGKLVAGGRARLGTSFDFAVARYNADGSPDPTFGGTGVVTTAIENGTDIIQGLVAQPDGKLVAAGWGFIVAHWHDFALVRYNVDGSLDPTWGGTGKVTTNIGPAAKSDDAPWDLIQQIDGKLVAAGETVDPTTMRTDFALVRYQADGTLDPTFGGTGIVVTPIGLGGSAHAVLQQADGRLVAAGRSDASDGSHVTLVRYDADGSLDASFGTGGIVVTPIGTDQGIALAIVQQPDDELVVAGEVHYVTNRTDFVLIRYHADGTLDTSFGGAGIVVTPIGTSSSAHALVVQGSRLLAAGTASLSGGVFALARYDADGTLDATFGQGGIVTTRVGGNGSANALTLQQDGKPVAAGGAYIGSGRIVLARYEGDPTGGPTSTTSTSSTSTVTTPTTTSSTTSSTTTSATTTTMGGGTPVQISLRSIGSEDGTVVESSATSGVGGFSSATLTNLQAGDHLSNGQAKGIVSFDTSSIPAGATIVSATLRLQRVGIWGTNPFTILGQCRIDVQTGAFGGNAALELGDFQAVATAAAAGTLSNALRNGDWSTGTLSAAGLAAINRTGRTQLRLAFEVHDNGNRISDRILYGSGDQADPTLRPELQVTYLQ